MRDRAPRHPYRVGAAIVATAVLALGLVLGNTASTSAVPVDSSIRVSCGARGGDPATLSALDLAAALVGSNKLALDLDITAADIPDAAGLGQQIDASFNWRASLDQALIDGAAGLVSSISVTNLTGTMLVTGPSSAPSFPSTAPNTSVTPVKGQPGLVDLGVVGGPITTTGGGIITYRVGALQFDSALTVGAPLNQSFDLKLSCSVQGSNLITTTTVRDPDAPIFSPEVIQRSAEAGESVEVDLLGDVITPGKTPLLPETLRIVDGPAGSDATIDEDGVFRLTAPAAAGTYATTVEVCGTPKPESGIPGVDEVQTMLLGANWAGFGSGGLTLRPVAFTLKVGEEETRLIWATDKGLLADPTPQNWAPPGAAGLVGQYALLTSYRAPRLTDVRAALEALPSVGAGNVDVTELRDPATNKLTGYRATYIGARAAQDVPAISLGQWYSVPPQEVLDRVGAAITEVTGSLGGDGTPAVPTALDGMTIPQADKYIGDKLLASIVGGPKVTDAEWQAWVKLRLLDSLIAAAPAIIAFINSLFPVKLATETVVEGEAATPPPPLCAQGIVEITVTEVADATTVPGSTPPGVTLGPATSQVAPQVAPQVAGTTQARGIGFVG